MRLNGCGHASPWLVDSSLRDGLQAPSWQPSQADQLALARALDAAGIDEIEAGIPIRGAASQGLIRSLTQSSRQAAISAWCRARSADIAAAADLGLDILHISLPSSQRWLEGCKASWADFLASLPSLVQQGQSCAPRISLGLIDASRAPLARLREVARLAARLGVWRLRLADTVGLWTPHQAATCVRSLRQAAPDLRLGIHAHNDLGQAVAVTLAALDAGAVSADVTVLGLGERAGNCALEPLALALQLQYRRPARLDLRCCPDLAAIAQRALAQGIPAQQPVVGGQAFAHASGIHIAQQLCDPLACQPCLPEQVGSQQQLIPSPLNGQHAQAFFDAIHQKPLAATA